MWRYFSTGKSNLKWRNAHFYYSPRIFDWISSSMHASRFIKRNLKSVLSLSRPPMNPETKPLSSGTGTSHNCCQHKHRGGRAAPAPAKPAAKYFCPMCDGVESDKPGACPKCGMALERNPAYVEITNAVLHLPDASGSPAGSSRRLPDLRHGAGTAQRSAPRSKTITPNCAT